MTSKIFKGDHFEIANKDCFDYIKTLQDSSLDLIIIDPPYYKVKSDAWDNQWQDVEHYLAWLDDFFYEIWRTLKNNGSFYCFCSPRLSAETEMLIKERFNVLNHIVWSKPTGMHKRQHKESLRSYFSSSERIIFAEHYGSEGRHKGQAGYSIKCEKLKQEVYKPLIDYFINAKNTLDITNKEIKTLTGTHMYKHWFSSSQWSLPSEKNYILLHDFFGKKANQKGIKNPFKLPFNDVLNNGESLKTKYENLSKQYADLKKQYEQLRRYFSVTAEVPYTDVWEFKSVQYYKGKHPCEKPQDLLKHIITASSRAGDTVADFFMGSGATTFACINLNRQFVGCELEKQYYDEIVKKLS